MSNWWKWALGLLVGGVTVGVGVAAAGGLGEYDPEEDFEEDPEEPNIEGEAQRAQPNARISGEELIEQIATYEGAPYKYGGATSKEEGLDCSGTPYRAARDKGVDIPRTARQQAVASRRLTEEEARQTPAAMVFLTRKGKPVTPDNVFHVEVSDGSGDWVWGAQVKGGVKKYKWGWWKKSYGDNCFYGILPHFEG